MPPSRVTGNFPAVLSRQRLLLALVIWLFTVAAVLLFGRGRPGDPLLQLCALVGSLLLLVSFYFSWHKRVAGADKPRQWFVAHVLAALLGSVLVVAHLRGGQWFSPPGAVACALVFLVVQGLVARATLGRHFAQLFARSPAAFSPHTRDRHELGIVIGEKKQLLSELDNGADEALFSLQWWHWLRRPRLSCRFALLVRQERTLVGAGQGVSLLLRAWRRLHMAVALVFLVGLFAHVAVVLFFAGYAAGDQPPYWWYFFAWGAGQ